MRVRYVTMSKAADMTGYSVRAMQEKIKEGVWPENVLWVRAPDGKRLIDLDGFERWVESSVMKRGPGVESLSPAPLI